LYEPLAKDVDPIPDIIPDIDTIGTMMGVVSASKLSELRSELGGDPSGEAGGAGPSQGGGGTGIAEQVAAVAVVEKTSGASGVPTPQSARVGSSQKGKELAIVPLVSAPVPASGAVLLRPRRRKEEKAVVGHAIATGEDDKKKKGKAKEEDVVAKEVAEFFSDEYYQRHVDSGYVFGKEARFRVSLASLDVSSFYVLCHCYWSLFPSTRLS
jgi:hypothetical protein